MRALASFVMRGPMQAVLVTVIFGSLSLIMFPFSILSGAAVGLVTLRQGAKQGAIVAVSAIVVTAIIAFISVGQPFFAIGFAALVWIPVWILAGILRLSLSLQKTLLSGIVFGWLTILITYAALDDPATWWLESVLQPMFSVAMEQPDVGETQRDVLTNYMAESAVKMTGFLAVFIMYFHLFMLMTARWWQSMLFNPGGFRSEFCSLNFGKPVTLVMVAFVLVALMDMGGLSTIAGHFSVVVFALFAFQGLAVVHTLVEKKSLSSAWLVAVYIIFMLFGQIVALLGMMDNWIAIRKYANKKKSTE